LRLNQEEGLTVLLVEQKLPFARRVASEFCILDKGRRVAAGPIGDLTDEVVKAHLSV
jgi:urea transport system ATP-binding protein